MSRVYDRRCICGHHEKFHIFDGTESICSREGCACGCFHLWEVLLLDPCGQRHKVSDVRYFVQEHKDLFDPQDLDWHYQPSDITQGDPVCRALGGLYSITNAKSSSWKGWAVLTFPKTFRVSHS